jgi:hypothetical protein
MDRDRYPGNLSALNLSRRMSLIEISGGSHTFVIHARELGFQENFRFVDSNIAEGRIFVDSCAFSFHLHTWICSATTSNSTQSLVMQTVLDAQHLHEILTDDAFDEIDDLH